MMSESKLLLFNNEEFGEIRTLLIEGEPWFVGNDIAAVLGYSRPVDAIRKRVEDEDKGVAKLATPGGQQDYTIINESGLYSLILTSKLPTAKKFKRWVLCGAPHNSQYADKKIMLSYSQKM